MRLNDREISERIGGEGKVTVRRLREWICPECDYFEEVESEG
jgi:acetone carboxylase gamma subunit